MCLVERSTRFVGCMWEVGMSGEKMSSFSYNIEERK